MTQSATKRPENHYDFADRVLPTLLEELNLNPDFGRGFSSAHGDKYYSLQDSIEAAGYTFNEGIIVALLSYISPYSTEVRDTSSGWVDPYKWILDNLERFKPLIDSADKATQTQG